MLQSQELKIETHLQNNQETEAIIALSSPGQLPADAIQHVKKECMEKMSAMFKNVATLVTKTT
jgi:hypothetical protein